MKTWTPPSTWLTVYGCLEACLEELKSSSDNACKCEVNDITITVYKNSCIEDLCDKWDMQRKITYKLFYENKMNQQQADALMRKVEQDKADYPCLRYGQAVMNRMKDELTIDTDTLDWYYTTPSGKKVPIEDIWEWNDQQKVYGYVYNEMVEK